MTSHLLFKQELNNTYCLVSGEGKKKGMTLKLFQLIEY